MFKLGKHARRIVLVVGLAAMTMSNSGCTLVTGFGDVLWAFCGFWGTTPLIPVSPYFSQQMKTRPLEGSTRYRARSVEGEHAPLFCLDHRRRMKSSIAADAWW
jgi:hypothetical protein